MLIVALVRGVPARTGLATDTIQLEAEDFLNPALRQTFKNLLIHIRLDFGTRVVAIDSDPNEPLFPSTHHALVGDLYQILPELIKNMEGGAVAA